MTNVEQALDSWGAYDRDDPFPLFAELREYGAEVLFGKCARGFEGSVECLARHEAADRALKEPAIAQLPRKPLAA